MGPGVPPSARLRSLSEDRALLRALLPYVAALLKDGGRGRGLLRGVAKDRHLGEMGHALHGTPFWESGVRYGECPFVTTHARRTGLFMGSVTYRKTQVTSFVLNRYAAVRKNRCIYSMVTFKRTSTVPYMLVFTCLHGGCTNGSPVGRAGSGCFLRRVRL